MAISSDEMARMRRHFEDLLSRQSFTQHQRDQQNQRDQQYSTGQQSDAGYKFDALGRTIHNAIQAEANRYPRQAMRIECGDQVLALVFDRFKVAGKDVTSCWVGGVILVPEKSLPANRWRMTVRGHTILQGNTS